MEALETPDGVELPYGQGRYRLYPVEYKHGVVRDEEEYQIQLCAQAMCLEEQFDCIIPAGAIFYINAHRRDEVALTESLREKTRQTAGSGGGAAALPRGSSATLQRKVQKCSMREDCQPKLKRSAANYCRDLWETAREDV